MHSSIIEIQWTTVNGRFKSMNHNRNILHILLWRGCTSLRFTQIGAEGRAFSVMIFDELGQLRRVLDKLNGCDTWRMNEIYIYIYMSHKTNYCRWLVIKVWSAWGHFLGEALSRQKPKGFQDFPRNTLADKTLHCFGSKLLDQSRWIDASYTPQN